MCVRLDIAQWMASFWLHKEKEYVLFANGQETLYVHIFSSIHRQNQILIFLFFKSEFTQELLSPRHSGLLKNAGFPHANKSEWPYETVANGIHQMCSWKNWLLEECGRAS